MMNTNIKKIITAACMAAFIATSLLPGISEAANGRMSLAQAQQEIRQPLHQKYPHYKTKHSQKLHRYDKHRPAMHTRGPADQTWVPVRHAPPHRLKHHGPDYKSKKSGFKPHAPMRPMSPTPPRHPEIGR